MGTVGHLSDVFDLGWSKEDIIRKQKEDSELSAIYTAVVNGAEQPPWESVALQSENTKILLSQWVRLSVRQCNTYPRPR